MAIDWDGDTMEKFFSFVKKRTSLDIEVDSINTVNEALALCSDARKRRDLFRRLPKSSLLSPGAFARRFLKHIAVGTYKTLSYDQKLGYLIGASYGAIAKATSASTDASNYPQSTKGSSAAQQSWRTGFRDAYRQGSRLQRRIELGSMSPETALRITFALLAVDEFCTDGGVAWMSAEHLARDLRWPYSATSNEAADVTRIPWDLPQVNSERDDPASDFVRTGKEEAVVAAEIRKGNRNENTLTNRIFFARHPGRRGKLLSRSEPQYAALSAEWLSIRNDIVRPALMKQNRTTRAGIPDDIVTVEGIQVHRSIASNVQRMVRDARRDGVELRGGGYRSPDSQIALRRKNCATRPGAPTDYDIFKKPSSQCTPPTARPGSSNHEKGLAIDFDFGSNRSSSGFRWLSKHASKYGLKNFSKEPWHWSVDGR
ncbi:MAG: M15 family metallopeptidase [Phycisphaerales bacterium]